MTLDHNGWMPQQLSIDKHQDIHIIVTFPPNTQVYPPAQQWPAYYNQFEIVLTTIICIHNLDTPPTCHTFAPNGNSFSMELIT